VADESLEPFVLSPTALPEEVGVALLMSWIAKFASERLALTQQGSGSESSGRRTYSFGAPNAAHFVVATTSPGDLWELTQCVDLPLDRVREVINESVARTAAGDLGGDVTYQVVMNTEPITIDARLGLHFQRLLGDQVRIVGKRRLSNQVVLDFSEDMPEPPTGPLLFAPRSHVKCYLFAPGPIHGPLSLNTAIGMAELTSAICTVALGRVAEFNATQLQSPVAESDAVAARTLRDDPAILGLARDGVSLDVFGELTQRGGSDSLLKVRGALLSHHAALQQSNADVATILLVTALEALITPAQPWRRERTTKRFVDALQELCPDAVDAMVGHSNVEQALAYKRRGGPQARRKQMLARLYDLRSTPAHEGLGLTRRSALMMLGDPGAMRVALVSGLVRAALLSFMQSPRSFLIGHPAFSRETWAVTPGAGPGP
jgi:hypothetical protein